MHKHDKLDWQLIYRKFSEFTKDLPQPIEKPPKKQGKMNLRRFTSSAKPNPQKAAQNTKISTISKNLAAKTVENKDKINTE